MTISRQARLTTTNVLCRRRGDRMTFLYSAVYTFFYKDWKKTPVSSCRNEGFKGTGEITAASGNAGMCKQLWQTSDPGTEKRRASAIRPSTSRKGREKRHVVDVGRAEGCDIFCTQRADVVQSASPADERRLTRFIDLNVDHHRRSAGASAGLMKTVGQWRSRRSRHPFAELPKTYLWLEQQGARDWRLSSPAWHLRAHALLVVLHRKRLQPCPRSGSNLWL